ncbi:thiamine pyrophosphate-binding protein [Alteribacter natronophilus]|uniref:thiamine pyrophosphate-binding protein n=1 Tax=Alteribacter natronophilus TaxID=2583810 RepID=UPI00110E1E58|nr:thiamine pyrophosphate-binding protein [Alteribacter natronophilus]TMW72046.1 thiamine pyrophosphate-binding protein [Alteribacter natronophilus]
MKAVRLVLDYLKSGGVNHIFGIPAGSVNAFFDELYDMPEMTPVVTKHEGAAGYMACSYARYANEMSVCISCSGPGATNMVTGAANAMREHLPVLFLTGAVPVNTVGLNASQELDAQPVFEPVTKYSVTVTDAKDLLAEVAKAAEIALDGVPGPVHVAMPIDVQLAEAPSVNMPAFPEKRPVVPDAEVISEVAKELAGRKSGILFAGQGIRNAGEQFHELAELLGWPIVTTPQARGMVKSNHPQLKGVFGFAGHESASELINSPRPDEAILVLGSSLGETATNNWNENLAKGRFLVQMDFDETVFNRKYAVDMQVHGDLKLSLLFLNEELRALGLGKDSREKEVVTRSTAAGEDYNTKNVFLRLQDLLPEDTRYTIDIGEFMAYVIHHMEVKKEGAFDINVHFGAMGSGIGSAIGSAFAEPDRPVAAITGDGCFFMHGMEMLTAKEYDLPVLFVVMNNARLGMVYHGHTLQYKRSHSSFEQEGVDIAAMAKALGVPSARVEKLSDIKEETVSRLTEHGGPAVLEVDLVDNSVPPMGDRVKFLSSFGK